MTSVTYGDVIASNKSVLDAGWWPPEDVEEIQRLFGFVDISSPRPGNKSDAALIAIAAGLGLLPYDDPHVTWAYALLKEIS